NSEQWRRETAYGFMGFKTSYAALARQIRKSADAFRTLGVAKGDRVLLCLPNVPQAIQALYGLNLLGAVAVFAHPLSSEGELAYYIENSDAKAVVTLKMFADKFRTELPVITNWSKFLRSGKIPAELPAVSADDPAVILYSGGTTGYPKGIVLSNLSFNALALQTAEAAQCIQRGKCMLAVMPVFHGFGLGICVHTALVHGCQCALVPRFSVSTFANLMKKANYIAGVPTLYEALLSAKELKRADLSRLMGVFCGGDTLSPELKRRFDAFLKERGATVRLREGYGMTECVTASCLTPPNADDEKEGSIGLPYPDTYYKTLDSGEICLRGPTLMLEYLGNPALTAEALQRHADGHVWLHTGDLGRIDADGYIYFLGRLKRVIVTSGYNVYPPQIERVLNSYPGIKTSAVIGVPHPYKMQVPKAFIVPADGAEIDLAKLREHLEKNVAKYALPKEIVTLKAMPTTKIGKVSYSVLEEDYAEFLPQSPKN
ncbi:MAG: AMP-binding protein, partial [Oscillospiraceae bacterium]|nr:AMP-binding protein [Oscillospiraceae bacterium]